MSQYSISYKEGNTSTGTIQGWSCIIIDQKANLTSEEWGATKGEAQENAFRSLNIQIKQIAIPLIPNQYDKISLELDSLNPMLAEKIEQIDTQKSSNTLWIILGVVAIIGGLVFGAIYLLGKKPESKNSISLSNKNVAVPKSDGSFNANQSQNVNPPKQTETRSNYQTGQTSSQHESDEINQKSSTASNSDDFYILNSTAVKTESQAINKANELRNKGYAAGYLWIPDYASLSQRQLFTVYIGPFYSQYECEKATEDYRRIVPGAYGTLVSQRRVRVQIIGIGKVLETPLDGAATTCQQLENGTEKYLIVLEDNIRVRSVNNSSSDASILFRLFEDDKAIILDNARNSKGELWYKICYQNQTGWIISDYVNLL